MDRLTPEELVSALGLRADGVERLELPGIGVAGLAGHGLAKAGNATVFPVPLAMAATFDTGLVERVATVIGTEARAWQLVVAAARGKSGQRGVSELVVLTPDVTPVMDARASGTAYRYGEDPLLAGTVGAAHLRGLAGEEKQWRVAAFMTGAAGRQRADGNFGQDVKMPPRVWQEWVLPAWERAVRGGRPAGVVVAGHAINGMPLVMNRDFLKGTLREAWGFEGALVAEERALARALHGFKAGGTRMDVAGLALAAGIDGEARLDVLLESMSAFQLRKASLTDIRLAAARMLRTRVALGLLDSGRANEYGRVSVALLGSPLHAQLALEAAHHSIVLLKNEPVQGRPVLPIDPKRSTRLLVAGPWAERRALGRDAGDDLRTDAAPAQALTSRWLGGSVTLAAWTGGSADAYLLVPVPPDRLSVDADGQAVRGLEAEYRDNTSGDGEPAAKRTDSRVDFNWAGGEIWPGEERAVERGRSVVWRGKIEPRRSGEHVVSVLGAGQFRLEVDGQMVLATTNSLDAPERRMTAKVRLRVGEPCALTLRYSTAGRGRVRLEWREPVDRAADDPFESAARNASAVVLCMGADPELSLKDRSSGDLPEDQVAFVRRMTALNPRTVVVWCGPPPSMVGDWVTSVPALLLAWEGGMRAGDAIADVVAGAVSPSGRLPISLASVETAPPEPGDGNVMAGRTYQWARSPARFPFGHGLGYGAFAYDRFECSASAATAAVSLRVAGLVRNTSTRDGQEVVQVYVRKKEPSPLQPVRRLLAYRRVRAAAGKSAPVEFTLPVADWKIWDETTGQWGFETGVYELEVGASSTDIRWRTEVRVP